MTEKNLQFEEHSDIYIQRGTTAVGGVSLQTFIMSEYPTEI